VGSTRNIREVALAVYFDEGGNIAGAVSSRTEGGRIERHRTHWFGDAADGAVAEPLAALRGGEGVRLYVIWAGEKKSRQLLG
jgi:hypothetical protein